MVLEASVEVLVLTLTTVRIKKIVRVLKEALDLVEVE